MCDNVSWQSTLEAPRSSMQFHWTAKIEKKRGLTHGEMKKITSLSAADKTTLEVCKEISLDHRTVKMFACNGKKARNRPKKSCTRKITKRDSRRLKVSMAKKTHSTCRAFNEEAGASNEGRHTKRKVLNKLGKVRKPSKQTHLNKTHKEKAEMSTGQTEDSFFKSPHHWWVRIERRLRPRRLVLR